MAPVDHLASRQEYAMPDLNHSERQDTVRAEVRSEASTSEDLPRFKSLLFTGATTDSVVEDGHSFAHDLNLDQIVATIAGRGEECDLIAELLYRHLDDVDTVRYRQEVFRDLEDESLFAQMRQFADAMSQVRNHIGQLTKMQSQYQREGWFLDAASIYCDAVRSLDEALRRAPLGSRALGAFRGFLATYVGSAAFATLVDDTNSRKEALGRLRYCSQDSGWTGRRQPLRGSSRLQRRGPGNVRALRAGRSKGLSRQLPILARNRTTSVPRSCNSSRDSFLRNSARWMTTAASTPSSSTRPSDASSVSSGSFSRIWSTSHPCVQRDFSFCYAELTATSKAIFATDTFDLALARKLVAGGKPIVRNDFHMEGPERIFVVSGPNQGGKTTFARMFGQLHHLAGVGCPVPGSAASLFLFDRLFVHFERKEDLTNMRGKLEDDLVRIREILQAATSKSIVIMNEIFTSTTLSDARFLGEKVMQKVIELDVLCVYVTFVDELTSLGDSVVSMISTIVPENPVERTYKVVRGPADGLAYALSIAEKHNVTYDRLRARIIA